MQKKKKKKEKESCKHFFECVHWNKTVILVATADLEGKKKPAEPE